MSSSRDRPWLPFYRTEASADLQPEFTNAVSLWRVSLARAADRPFLYYFGATLTFGRVDTESDALAAALAERGIGHGDRIALHLHHVPQFVIGALAAWKLGAVAVPVNPTLPERELRAVFDDSGVVAVVSLDDLWASRGASAAAGTATAVAITTSPLDYFDDHELPPSMATVRHVETPGTLDFVDLVRSCAGHAPEPETPQGRDAALLTYDAGTGGTGELRGEWTTHADVAAGAHAYRDWADLDATDVALAGVPLFHSTGLLAQLAVAMLVPTPLVLGFRFDAATMNALVERYRCTYTVMPENALAAMMNDPGVGRWDLSSLVRAYHADTVHAVSV